MIKNHTICTIEVVDKKSKLTYEKALELCSELSPRTVVSYIKDDKGNHTFLKGTRTTLKNSFRLDLDSYEDLSLVENKYSASLCRNCRIVCRVDLDNPRLQLEFDRSFEAIREMLTGIPSSEKEIAVDSSTDSVEVDPYESFGNFEEKSEMETTPSKIEDVSLSNGLTEPIVISNVFSGLLNRGNSSEIKLSELTNELEYKVNELLRFIDVYKLNINPRQLEDVIDKLDYSSKILKSVVDPLR